MAQDSFKVKKSINIEPKTSPSLTETGDIGYNSTSNEFEVRDNAATRSLVTDDGTQTLTNKTLDGASNTFTNIPTSALDLADDTTVNVATSNSNSTVNIGTGSGTNTINLGGANTTVNITGTVNNQNVTNLNVTDKLITINDGGGAASGGGSGIEVEENAVATGYVKVSTDRNAWEFKAPNTNGVATLTTGASADAVVLAAATQTLTNKTIDTANNTIKSGTATATYVLTADGSGNTSWAAQAAGVGNPFELSNLTLVCSVASNALTIALKTEAGADPSAGSPVKIGMRNSTLTSGSYNQRSVTAATSIVVSSGSTLGHTSGNEHNIWVYAIDNSGTIELAVSQTLFNEGELISTTAEGGAGAADSNRTMYSTTARTNVSFRVIGLLKSTQTTAGTWAAVPTNVILAPSQKAITDLVSAAYYASSNKSVSTTQPIDFDTKVWDSHGAVTTGSSWKFTAPTSGTYLVNYLGSITTAVSAFVRIYKGGTNNKNIAYIISGGVGTGARKIKLLAQEYIDIRMSTSLTATGGSESADGTSGIEITRIGNY